MRYFYTRRLLAPIPEGGNQTIGAGAVHLSWLCRNAKKPAQRQSFFLFVSSKDKEKAAVVAKTARKHRGS